MIYNYNLTYDKILKILENNPNVLKNFRYYLSRDSSCFDNHLIHFICEEDDEFIGYGHLDYENKLWLGMFVSDFKVGMGYGKIILSKLINSTDQDIYLTVDKINISAINLYLGNGFRIYDQTDKIYYCRMIKNG